MFTTVQVNIIPVA